MVKLSGQDNLTLYTFNTHVAQHYFCKTCGITSFYVPRCAPKDYGITYDCLDGDDRPPKAAWKDFDGQNWEKFYEEYVSSTKSS